MSSEYLPREDCRVTVCKLPPHVKGLCTVKGADELIFINEDLSEEAKIAAFAHELRHLRRGDLYSEEPVSKIEKNIKEDWSYERLEDS